MVYYRWLKQEEACHMISPIKEINGLEKALDIVIHNVLDVKRNLLELKRKMFIKKGELDSLVERVSKLIKKTKEDYDATELIRTMRNRPYDI